MAIYTIQLKRGKASSWATLNPVLQPGEPGYEIDTGKLKIGNGVDEWFDLKYLGDDKDLVLTAKTHYDFPEIGESDVIYKASEEKQLYQWNDELTQYELLVSNQFVTYEQMNTVINQSIKELSLEDYATKAYALDLFGKMIPLTHEEIIEICNK